MPGSHACERSGCVAQRHDNLDELTFVAAADAGTGALVAFVQARLGAQPQRDGTLGERFVRLAGALAGCSSQLLGSSQRHTHDVFRVGSEVSEAACPPELEPQGVEQQLTQLLEGVGAGGATVPQRLHRAGAHVVDGAGIAVGDARDGVALARVAHLPLVDPRPRDAQTLLVAASEGLELWWQLAALLGRALHEDGRRRRLGRGP